MRQIKIVSRFFSKYFLILLFIITLISYGQLLLMKPWQEDNVIFFKVAHIEEQAGYLGKGIWGSGIYRHIITPYYFLYLIFGYNIPLFFGLALFFFFLACCSIYTFLRILINKKAAMLGSFFFSAGYIAFDGFVRVYNSISTSLGVIFLSLLLSSYWSFFKERTIKWYLLTLLFYFMIVELAFIRAHYLILPILFFEFVFIAKPYKLTNFLTSILKVIPFIFIFYKWYIEGGDNRATSVVDVVKSIISGKYENTFSLFTTIGNLFVPDKFQEFLIGLISASNLFPNTQLLIELSLFFLIFVVISFFIIPPRKNKMIYSLTLLLGALWLLFSKYIFTRPTLIYTSQQTVLAGFIGGISIILILTLALKLGKISSKLVIFFLFLIITNIAAYASYTPTVPYGTGYRYLAQSYVGLIAILTLTWDYLNRKYKKKYITPLFIAWGVILLLLGVSNLNNIIQNKSNKIDSFYKQLKKEVPYFPKGSLVYFDIQNSQEARSFYSVSFSVAEMPDTTAIAWRYGIDRYDIQMFTEYATLLDEIKKDRVPLDKVFTFWMTDKDLVQTTNSFRKLAQITNDFANVSTVASSSSQIVKAIPTKVIQPEIVLNLQNITTITPIELQADIKATPGNFSIETFPLRFNNTRDETFYRSVKLQSLAFDYQSAKNELLEKAKYQTSSDWQERAVGHLHDNNLSTIWQSDRVLWRNHNAYYIIDLGKEEEISGLYWVNGISNNTPTIYQVETSLDGKDFNLASHVSNVTRLSTTDTQVTKFDSIKARYIKMTILSTLSDDSPAIAESWPLYTKFKDVDISTLSEYIKRPFDLIVGYQNFLDTLQNVKQTGLVRIYWMGDKDSSSWQTENDSIIPVIYDGITRRYNLIIRPNGTKLNSIKIGDFTIPGKLEIFNLSLRNLAIN